MNKSILNKLIDSIEDALPSPKNYTEEAYEQLVNNVICVVFGSRVDMAVFLAHETLAWNKETEVWEVES